MTAKRAHRAWLLLLVLTLLLGLVCLASAHSHSCDDRALCPICHFLNDSGLRLCVWALLLALTATMALSRRVALSVRALHCRSLVASKIRLND